MTAWARHAIPLPPPMAARSQQHLRSVPSPFRSPMNRTCLLPLLTCAALIARAPAQEEPTKAKEPAATPQKLEWPRDRDRVICRVAGTDYTLIQLLEHIQERHEPRMLALMELPTGAAYLQHPRMASWVRQFADVIALEGEAKSRGLSYEDVEATLGNALKKGFELHLEGYVDRRARSGSPVELTQERINLLLADYQRDFGLECEVRGWLDALVPAVSVEETQRLRAFYDEHPQWFGGVVTISQIMVEHRDPRTLELLTGDARRAAYAKLADIEARIAPDGSNFEEVARLLSDDERTARNGGQMAGIERFDDRLPAVLCRTAWQLRDGQVSTPVESAFGIHIVKRISYKHRYYVVFTDAIRGEVADTMRRAEQENMLFGARERSGVRLLY